jgi:hypothetical protein
MMKQLLRIVTFLALLAILPQVAQGADPEIAFTGRDGIGIMDRDGSNIEWLRETGHRPDWSPNGDSLVFDETSPGEYDGLWRIDLDRPDLPILIAPDGRFLNGTNTIYWSLTHPAWSPRERTPGVGEIAGNAYIEIPGGVAKSVLVITDEWGNEGVDLLYVSDHFPTLRPLTWSPDGSRIATFESVGSGWATLLIIDRDTLDWVWPPMDPVFRPWDIEWSRYGDRIVFAAGEGRQDEWIYTLDLGLDFLVPERIAKGRHASWSPDDSQLVFGTFNDKINSYTFATGAVENLGAGDHPEWRRDVDLICTSHADCEPGDLCCDSSCATPECVIASDCDDGDICTIGECLDPGSCNAFCDTTYAACGPADGCCGPDCDYYTDPDCPDCVPTHSKEKGPRCSDGIDNDCDGLIDGNDPDCG